MLTVNPSTFGLYADVPEVALDPEWRALVRQQACTLAGMLQRIRTAVAGVPDRTDARRHAPARVHALAADAEQHVRLWQDRAAQREREGLEQQVSAVRLRLQRELGRYLASLGIGTADLNELLHQQMTREIAGAQRLKQAFTKLGGYPNWSPALLHDWLLLPNPRQSKIGCQRVRIG